MLKIFNAQSETLILFKLGQLPKLNSCNDEVTNKSLSIEYLYALKEVNSVVFIKIVFKLLSA